MWSLIEILIVHYFIFLDSDCLIPENYLNATDKALAAMPLDLFGGPDAARGDFSNLQKAISYAMTATITTPVITFFFMC
mgnify:CR=1 FL=1